jgi:hypothetical protein
MIICGMAKKPHSPPTPPAKRRRGRPPKPGGPIPQAEVQRAYRARLAAGKVLRLVDAASARPVLTSIPGFDPAPQLICDRKTFKDMRDNLHNALVKLEVRDQDVARLETRNAYLEHELKRTERRLSAKQR